MMKYHSLNMLLYYTIHLLAPNYLGLKVSKKVRYTPVVQRTSKLVHVKVGSSTRLSRNASKLPIFGCIAWGKL